MRLRTHVDPTRATSPTTPNGCILSLAVLIVCAGCGGSDGGGAGSDWSGGSAWNGGTKGTGSSSGSDGGSSPRGSSSSGGGNSSSGSSGGGGSGGSSSGSGGSSGSSSGSGGSSGANSPFDQFQRHNLDVVNKYRSGMGIAPLALDQTICTFALAGSQEESQDHSPHQHFIDSCSAGPCPAMGVVAEAHRRLNGIGSNSHAPTHAEHSPGSEQHQR